MKADSVTVASNAIPSGPVSLPTDRRSNIRTIGFLGRLERQKGCDIFISACRNLLQAHPRTKIVIAGDGTMRADLTALAAKLGIAPEIEFSGAAESSESVLAGMDLLVMPSRWEGNSYTLWEAVRHRVPFIVSDIPIHRELLGSQSICLFSSGDPDALCSKLKLFIANPDSIASAIDFESLEGRYKFEHQMETIAGVYQACVGRNGVKNGL